MKRIFVIGDSISLQYGPFLSKYLEGRIGYSRKSGDDEAFKNLDNPAGANGGDSSMVLAYLEAVFKTPNHPASTCDLLLINCGLHDIKTKPGTAIRQVNIEDYRKNMTSIVAIVRKNQVPMAWIRTTPCDENIHNTRPGMEFHRFSADCQAYNRVADEIMTAHRIPSLDLYNFTLSIGGNIYRDHVHFIDPVQQLQGAFISGWVSAWLSEK